MVRARVDFQAKTMVVGIRELVEPARESARGVGILPLLRAEIGRAVHERYRQARERAARDAAPALLARGVHSEFRAEVALCLEHEIQGFRAVARGRADGVTRTVTERPGGAQSRAVLTVEEVKSMAMGAREIHDLTLDAVSDHALQARLYALALSRAEPEAEIQARLILVSILDNYQRTVDLDFTVEGAERALERLLARALAEAKEARRVAEKRMAAAKALVFPYPSMRPRQDGFIAGVKDSLERERPVLACAPTGMGKTVSALFAGLGFALERGASLYFVTAKTTQQALVARTFVELRAAAPPLARAGISAVTVRAKERMCPPGDLFCHPEVCPYLADFAERVVERDALTELLAAPDGHVSPERIFAFGRDNQLCPFELSLRVAARAELVIADYNYVYDPGVALAPFSDKACARSAAVVVDEGHNLLDRARDYYAVFIGRATVDEVRARLAAGAYLGPGRAPGRATPFDPASQLDLDDLAAGDEPSDEAGLLAKGQGALPGSRLFRELDRLFSDIARTIDAAGHAHLGRARGTRPRLAMDGYATMARDPDTWRPLAERATRLLLAFSLYTRARRLVFVRDPLPELLREVVRMRDAVLADEPEIVPYVTDSRAPKGPGLGVLCVDPGPRLGERHGRALGTAVMSATLSPLEYYAQVLGFAALQPALVRMDSPFPARNRAVLIVPTVDTSFRRRGAHVDEIARTIGTVVGARPGRYIAFFSSFSFLFQVARALVLPDHEVMAQEPSMDQAARDQLLARLCRSPGRALLLAVSGGVFAEGVDLPGDQLIGAIVVGPSLPVLDFERALMRIYHQQQGRDGFAYAMLYPGMQRVIQSAGRVIRSMDDRGVIALLGQRFTEPRYARLLPPEWYARDIRELVTHEPAVRLAGFWADINRRAQRIGDRAPGAAGDPRALPRTPDRGSR